VRRLAHFMAPLVPLVVLRWARRAMSRKGTAFDRRRLELSVVPGLNQAMSAVLAFERPLVRLGGMPFGSSLIAVASRPRE
jgi:hypothetical protein